MLYDLETDTESDQGEIEQVSETELAAFRAKFENPEIGKAIEALKLTALRRLMDIADRIDDPGVLRSIIKELERDAGQGPSRLCRAEVDQLKREVGSERSQAAEPSRPKWRERTTRLISVVIPWL